jgi:hypothetical protein
MESAAADIFAAQRQDRIQGPGVRTAVRPPGVRLSSPATLPPRAAMLTPAPLEPEPIEEVIGAAMAAAALALLAGVQQWLADGQRIGTPAIKQKSKVGGDLIAQLWQLRQATLGELDFESTARIYGEQALRKRCNGGGFPTKTGGILIDGVLEISDEVVRAQLN